MGIPAAVTDCDRATLRQLLQERGEPGWRSEQILQGIFGRRARGYEAMTDLPAELRSRLAGEIPLLGTRVTRRSDSDDGTVKLLIGLADGETVECVMIPEGKRRTACLSTQVGCPVGCVFCASGLAGVRRNLTAGEIVDQALHLTDLLPAGDRLTHVVVMGMGEPFLNYDRLLAALETLHAKWGLGIGAHRITVSTVGLVDKIEAFAEHPLATNLAVSLHAPDEALRAELIPHVAKTTIDALVGAAVAYRERTRKDVTFEYVLIAGKNDQLAHAGALAGHVRGTGIKVNLIPLNRISFAPLTAPANSQVTAFLAVLEREGVPCTIRRRRGSDVDAACGQLRLESAQHESAVQPELRGPLENHLRGEPGEEGAGGAE